MDSSVHAVIVSRYIQDRIDEANAAGAARKARRSNRSRNRKSQRDAGRLAGQRRRWSPARPRRERSGQSAA
jgi:hypothetical protein